MGLVAAVSVIGTAAVTPYTVPPEDTKTIFRTPAARHNSSSCTEATVLICRSAIGSLLDTSGFAPPSKWKTISARSTASASPARSVNSPRVKRMDGGNELAKAGVRPSSTQPSAGRH